MHSRFVENHSIWILEDGPLISEVVLSQPPHCFGTAVSVTLASMLCRSSLLLVRLFVINPEMFMCTMLASSVDILDFGFIGRHFML
jgi:hypothetical protein